MTGIVVDGARPAVEWVTSLPSEWRVTESERLVLLCLACDAYKFESAPGYEAVAEWTGMKRSSCAEILTRICKPTERRPALVERISTRGRRRTIWRLLVDSQPSGHAGRLNRPAPQDGSGSQPSGVTGRLGGVDGEPNRPASQDGCDANQPRTVGEPSANRPATPDAPLTLNPKEQEQVLRTCSDAGASDQLDPPPLFEVTVTPPPRQPRAKRKPKEKQPPNPHHPLAKELCDEWWTACPIKPAGKNAYTATLMLVIADIEVGRTEAEIRPALRSCGVAVTRSALNLQYELQSRRNQPPGPSRTDAAVGDLLAKARAARAAIGHQPALGGAQ